MSAASQGKEAVLWESVEDRKVRCRLCSFRCVIADGQLGHCQVRRNVGGTLVSLNYDKVCAANPDPIEKKPLFHFMPGTQSFSIAAVGCNFRCSFCQNWQISQMALEDGRLDGQAITPEQIVAAAVRSGCKSIAYTYTEPTVFMELCCECGRLAKEQGLANVFVSNGYMTPEAIDLPPIGSTASTSILRRLTTGITGIVSGSLTAGLRYHRSYRPEHGYLDGSHHAPGAPTKTTPKTNSNSWLNFSFVTLVPTCPGISAGFTRNTNIWIHMSRRPRVFSEPSVSAKTLGCAMSIGAMCPDRDRKVHFCYQCGRLLIERVGYRIGANHIENSQCPDCGTTIAGVQL